MKLEAVWHQSLSHYASAIDDKTIVIRIRAAKDDLKQCDLYYGDRAYMKNPILMFKLPMEKVASDALFDYYEAEIKSDYKRICYYFHLQDGKTDIYYLGGRFVGRTDFSRTEFFQFPYIRREDIARVPEWAKEIVMYQIFPDSFASGYKTISKCGKVIKNNCGELSVSEQGGTLQGIMDNLDYLADLGINCLYLNPIFVAGAYHKYDIVDYLDIDPCFGSKEQFKKMVQLCHERGIRVILDGVFNHCSSRFFAFADLLEKEEASRYKDWFYEVQFPMEYKVPPNYQAFAYVKEMPKLNTGNPEVIDYFCNVGEYWIREMGIDGWRLDVANEVNHDFWRTFRRRIRAVKEDAFLIGEIWEDAECWLNGDQFDSTMNYRFSTICREFFGLGNLNEEEFSNEMITMLMRYQKNITYAQMNLLDSHDVPRFLYYCGNDSRKLILATLYQMTFIGIPSVFYGDEMLISGREEREYRKPMIWQPDSKEKKNYDRFKELIVLRKSNDAFIKGNYRVIKVDKEKHFLVYERSYNNECFWIILHNSSKNKTLNLKLPAAYKKVWDTEDRKREESTETIFDMNFNSYEGVVLQVYKNDGLTENEKMVKEKMIKRLS